MRAIPAACHLPHTTRGIPRALYLAERKNSRPHTPEDGCSCMPKRCYRNGYRFISSAFWIMVSAVMIDLELV